MCGDSADTIAPIELLPVELLQRLTDAHCHPSDDVDVETAIESIDRLELRNLCAQSSTLGNQSITESIGKARPEKITPFFGLHPWFIHSISLQDPPPSKSEHYASLFPSPTSPDSPHPILDQFLPYLPEPISLSDFMISLESRLADDSSSLVGEIGLDKSFHLPLPTGLFSSFPKTRLQTPLSHQLALVRAQIDLAIKLDRHVSFHSVRAPMDTVELLKEYKSKNHGFGKIHVCLHSFGGKPESVQQIQKAHRNVYFSFSICVSGRSPRFHDMLKSVKQDRILVESDYSCTKQVDHQISQVVREICEARIWTAEECVTILEENWERFLELEVEEAGPVAQAKSRKERRMDEVEKRRRARERGAV